MQPETIHIDEWFARQDAAVEQQAKILKKNASRRKTLNQAEIQRRVNERIEADQRRLIDAVMAARALYGLIASNDVTMGYTLISDFVSSPGLNHFNAIYKSIHGVDAPHRPEKSSIPFARAMYASHATEVRIEVVAEMRAELQKRLDEKKKS